MPMPTKFHQLLRSIGKTCEAQSPTEAEVEKIFQEKGFFVELGYEGFGKDLLAQRGKSRKRFDVALTGFGGRVHAAIEFKKPAAGSLDSFVDELYEKYVKPELAIFGVLTNGVEILIFARANGQFSDQLKGGCKLSEITEGDALKIQKWLTKQKVNLDSLESVLERLRYHRQNVLLISDPDSEAARIFFQVFQLRPESAFGRLTTALKELLPKTVDASRFTSGSYDFWRKTYARELKYENIPDSWRPFLVSGATAEIAQFSFALETAYTIISRLMLAKAAGDKGFPGVRFIPRIQESLQELEVRGRLAPEKHRIIVERCFKRASEVLFSTIFQQDIFDWWEECPEAESRALFYALGEAILTVTQFDFLDLSGDLMGELYQHYFDRDTRKALGEFYTPEEVIKFILDECGYTGQRGDRLLDPACGSGSFVAAALRRYLHAQRGVEPKKILLDLTDGLRIIGFDINPFAVLMAQLNYAALILQVYSEAINDDRDFRIVRLPVFRTDSLRIEEREEEGGKSANGTPNFKFQEKTLDISIYLPIKGEKKNFHRVFVSVPRYQDARDGGLVGNLEDYVAALARLFQAVRDHRFTLESLLRARFGDRAEKLYAYLLPAKEKLEATVAELKGKYDDGRFLKTIEDLVLAVSLKHDLQYDFVVGNPPYVRIQKIPEHVKEYWAGKYEWTEHNYDLYVPFLERAVRSPDREGWLGKGGRLGFILSDRFLNVNYAQKLREEIPEKLRLELLFDFRDTRVFVDAMNYPAILIATRHDDGRKGNLQAARVFTSDTTFDNIQAEFRTLRKRLASDTVVRGNAVEVFTFPRNCLHGPGWWTMPVDEREVFEKLQKTAGRALVELTATASGGFAGYQTSADKHLVFDELEDRGDTLRVRVRHKKEDCGCENKPPEIEKAALRPFLFGRDVDRWSIGWKRSWVMFPYDRYPKKRTLDGEVIEEWNLIPSKANIGEFQFLDPDSIELFDHRFPKAWKYLLKHEAKLRARESNRFAENKPEGLLWYGATYPRGLEYYFRPKLVLQVLSRRPSVTIDLNGRYVFTAGGTAGVYGIALNENTKEDLLSVAATLNSRVTDFCVKEVSSVFGGRYYSYGDQFIANIVIPIKSKIFKSLAPISSNILDSVERETKLHRKVSTFPESFIGDLTRYELDSVGKLCRTEPTSAQISLDLDAISVQSTLYGFEVKFGSQHSFEFEYREHAECLAEAFKTRDRKTLPLNEVLAWRLPVKPEGSKKLLELLHQSRDEWKRAGEKIQADEDQLNDAVYKLYGVTSDERKVIEDFLDRYSSHPVGSVAPDEEGLESDA
jgi:hypothetical protein